MLLQSVSRASVRGGGPVGAESGQAEPNPARRGPPRPKTQPGAFPGSLRIRRRERLSGGADPTCAHRERHPRFRTLTQRSVLTDTQTDWAGKWARRGTCMALESTLVPFVWPRTAAGCDQGPPSVEPRWRRCRPNPKLDESCLGMSTRTLFTCHVHTNQRAGTNFLRCC